jgi:TRAP-type mannitol/chloroaromatic compound transport system permease large subunit
MAPFYLKGVAPSKVTINEIFSGVYPFMWLVLVFMVLMYMFPGMALWLPQAMYRQVFWGVTDVSPNIICSMMLST